MPEALVIFLFKQRARGTILKNNSLHLRSNHHSAHAKGNLLQFIIGGYGHLYISFKFALLLIFFCYNFPLTIQFLRIGHYDDL